MQPTSERSSLSCPDREKRYAGRGFHVPTAMADDDETTEFGLSRKPLSSHNFRRVTRWDRVTRIRESETISTRFGPFGRVTASRDLITTLRTKSQESRYPCTKIDKAR